MGLPLYRLDPVELPELEFGTGRRRDEGTDQIQREAIRGLRLRRVRRRQLSRPRGKRIQAGDGPRDDQSVWRKLTVRRPWSHRLLRFRLLAEVHAGRK